MLEYIMAHSCLSNKQDGRNRPNVTEPCRMHPRDPSAITPVALPAAPSPSPSLPAPPARIGARAYVIGLAGTVLVDLWIHYAELVLGGTRGHSALANTSIPLGAFCVLFMLVIANRELRSRTPRWALTPPELLVAYVMMTVATVLSSSGMLHFILPTVAAPVYFATSENHWAQLVRPFLKPWMAQMDPAALRGFYRGGEPVPVAAWLPQMATWCGFLVVLALTALCLAALVRRQWVDRERLTQIARNVVKDIGYDQNGFSYHGADVEVLLHGQSPDIAMGVNAKKKKGKEEEGAGDQGMMFGYACTESEVYEKGSYMPAPIYFAHKILKVLSEKRRSGSLADLQPDAKSQVTVQYVDGKPVGCTKVVVSTQHNEKSRNGKKYTPGMVKDLIGDAVESALPKGWMPKKGSDFLVNPTGNFVVGGPDGDCGLTGRKIIVDTYGGYAPHGGGAFSGKDPTKVDRSAAYAARYLAKNVVAAGLATQCTIQIAYAIGVADPMSVLVDTHGTSKIDERKLAKVLPEIFRLTPTNIRRSLKLNRPIYRRTAAYGHFGRAPDKDGGFSWEQTNLVSQLKSAFK